VRSHQDAYGHMLADYQIGRRFGREVVERDDGYVDAAGGPAAYFRTYREWPVHEKKAMRYVRGRVLDIGCGAGRHSLYLQERGHDVVGIDASARAIQVSRARGLEHARVLSVTQVSPRLGTFDTILMLGNNFGLFGNLRRARWLLGRFRRFTADSARIITESNDLHRTANPWHLRYHRLNRARGRLPGRLRIRVRYLAYATPWFEYLLVSPDEMELVLSGTGWRAVRFIESDGPAYIAVIEKEA